MLWLEAMISGLRDGNELGDIWLIKQSWLRMHWKCFAEGPAKTLQAQNVGIRCLILSISAAVAMVRAPSLFRQV